MGMSRVAREAGLATGGADGGGGATAVPLVPFLAGNQGARSRAINTGPATMFVTEPTTKTAVGASKGIAAEAIVM